MEIGWENFLMLVDNFVSLSSFLSLLSLNSEEVIWYTLSGNLQWSGWSLFPIIK